MNNIAMIGGGNMGSAIVSRIKNNYKVVIVEKDPARQKFIKNKLKVKLSNLKDAVLNSNVIILAVKPQDFDLVLAELAENITPKHLVISIAAGITTQYIEKRLPQKSKVIRTMPNLPAQIGLSMTGICKGRFASASDLKFTQEIFNRVGQTLVVQEKWIDSITAVSGSGPAYVFLFVECFFNAARSLGFDVNQSKQLIAQTIYGSLELLEKSGEMPSTLRERVTSKGGTTQAALDVFFSHNIENIFKQAVTAAKKRAAQLSK